MKKSRSLTAIAAAALVAAAGCASLPPSRSVDVGVSFAPGRAWQPPSAARLPAPTPPPAPAIPAEYLQPGATLSLSQVLDLALRNNPLTRASWFQAKSAAADLGSKRSEYFPAIELDGSITRQKQAALGGRSIF